jgi:adenosylcobinamide-phosphate synthase
MEFIIILAIAVAIDLAVGDPPNVVHPVAWIGKVIGFLEKGGLKLRPGVQFIYGIAMTVITIALFVIPVYFILFYLEQASTIAGVILAAIFLKLTFSIQGLRRTVLKIKKLLEENKRDETRHELRALVSRDTRDLDDPMLASSAVESVAEGTGDSVVAPLFYFLLFGIPGAIAYRAVNTLDSMIGYHGKYEYLGKFASILDDILNFIPARLAALLLSFAAWLLKRRGAHAWRTALREHTKTESPNAGWPMAAMAGALNVRLEKPGHYVLGNKNPLPVPDTIDESTRLFMMAVTAWIVLCFIVEVIRFVATT